MKKEVINKIKKEVAKEYGYKTLEDLNEKEPGLLDEAMDKVATKITELKADDIMDKLQKILNK